MSDIFPQISVINNSVSAELIQIRYSKSIVPRIYYRCVCKRYIVKEEEYIKVLNKQMLN